MDALGDICVGNVQLGGAYAGPARMAQFVAGIPETVRSAPKNSQNCQLKMMPSYRLFPFSFSFLSIFYLHLSISICVWNNCTPYLSFRCSRPLFSFCLQRTHARNAHAIEDALAHATHTRTRNTHSRCFVVVVAFFWSF